MKMNLSRASGLRILAAVAHPDDMEFMMAGTLMRLHEAGCEIHLWNLSEGDCGSEVQGAEDIAAIRLREARDAAKVLGAAHHPPLFNDLGIFYDRASLAQVAARIREIQPDVILTHSPEDYMEDHQNTCRLIVSAAFSRGMANFRTDPPRQAAAKPAAVYHALPHGLKGATRNVIRSHFFVDIGSCMPAKQKMLQCHQSQLEWLSASQGMGSYVEEMRALSRAMGAQSGRFEFAEGWRRHSHLGFATEDFDPVCELLHDHCVDANGEG